MSVPPIRKIRESDFPRLRARQAAMLAKVGVINTTGTPLELLAEAEEAEREARELAETEARHQRELAEFERDGRTGAARVIRCGRCGLEFSAVLSPEEMRAFNRVPSGGYRGTCPPCRNTAAPAVN